MINNDETNRSNRSKQSCLERTNLLSEYINHNLLAFQYLRNRNYKTAMTTFEKSIEIAKDLDEVKHVESLTNHGICQYFCGKFADSYISLDKAKEISNRLIENYLNDKSIQYLHLRVMCNLSLTSLSLNKISECRAYFTNCLELVYSQLELSEKINMLKELVYIFFRIDSLKNYYDQNINNYLESNIRQDLVNDNDLSMINQRMISKTLFSLHKTLRENNIEPWMKCLNEEAKKLRSLKDINGYIFVLINSFAANYYQTGKVTEGVKTNFSRILKIYAEQYNKDLKFKEKNLNNILSDFKSRIDLAMEIYKKLLDTEAELNSLFSNVGLDRSKNKSKDLTISKIQEGHKENNKKQNSEVDVGISNKIFIKIFFKRALRQLNSDSNLNYSTDKLNPNISTDMKSQIELALKLLENDEFDCSSINIFNINSEITKSLNTLIENLILIRNKSILYVYFKNYMKQVFGFNDIMLKRRHKIQLFMENRVDVICAGGEITKIHFNSSGFSKHYYKVNQENLSLLIYKNRIAYEQNDDKPYKIIPFSEIKEIIYGLNSDNLKSKYKNLKEKKINCQWLFLSLMIPKKKRSIDFYFDTEENLSNWFYGLLYFIRGHSLDINICSIFEFIKSKLKLKLTAKLKQIAEIDEANPNRSLLILNQLNNYLHTNEMGFNSLTFIQTLLLYRKIIEKRGSFQNIDGIIQK